MIRSFPDTQFYNKIILFGLFNFNFNLMIDLIQKGNINNRISFPMFYLIYNYLMTIVKQFFKFLF